METGLGPKLAALLDCPLGEVQFEVAWALTNVTTGTKLYGAVLIKLDVHEKLVRLFRESTDHSVREQVSSVLNPLKRHCGHSQIWRPIPHRSATR